ncbi:PREDICTED: plasma kallikrein-like [Vollenhovia emeryi]|uniref:plasma kallikrein-like n=1 Tax=Vollenhovia emeryi TaxID=411798 RepID=UPI0005F3F054|nr:PREDICTED: plasma kallikrein-like [Vollenhovia emeryi]
MIAATVFLVAETMSENDFDYVMPVPFFAHPLDKFTVGKDARVISWAKDRMADNGTERLKYVTLPIIDNNMCKRYWDIDSEHVCTVAGLERDACQSDTGGALAAVDVNGLQRQIGIASYGDTLYSSDAPGVFTKVSAHIEWIYDVTHIRTLGNALKFYPTVAYPAKLASTDASGGQVCAALSFTTLPRGFTISGPDEGLIPDPGIRCWLVPASI